jgi:hypothetical protein
LLKGAGLKLAAGGILLQFPKCWVATVHASGPLILSLHSCQEEINSPEQSAGQGLTRKPPNAVHWESDLTSCVHRAQEAACSSHPCLGRSWAGGSTISWLEEDTRKILVVQVKGPVYANAPRLAQLQSLWEL